MVGVGSQLVPTATSLRLREKEQWSAEALEGLRGLVPWMFKADGKVPKALHDGVLQGD